MICGRIVLLILLPELTSLEVSGQCHVPSSTLTRHKKVGTIVYPPEGSNAREMQICTWKFQLTKIQAICMEVQQMRLQKQKRCQNFVVFPDGEKQCGQQPKSKRCYKKQSSKCISSESNYFYNLNRPTLSLMTHRRITANEGFQLNYTIIDCKVSSSRKNYKNTYKSKSEIIYKANRRKFLEEFATKKLKNLMPDVVKDASMHMNPPRREPKCIEEGIITVILTIILLTLLEGIGWLFFTRIWRHRVATVHRQSKANSQNEAHEDCARGNGSLADTEACKRKIVNNQNFKHVI